MEVWFGQISSGQELHLLWKKVSHTQIQLYGQFSKAETNQLSIHTLWSDSGCNLTHSSSLVTYFSSPEKQEFITFLPQIDTCSVLCAGLLRTLQQEASDLHLTVALYCVACVDSSFLISALLSKVHWSMSVYTVSNSPHLVMWKVYIATQNCKNDTLEIFGIRMHHWLA